MSLTVIAVVNSAIPSTTSSCVMKSFVNLERGVAPVFLGFVALARVKVYVPLFAENEPRSASLRLVALMR